MPLIIQGVTVILRGTSAVTKRYWNAIRFTPSKKRQVEAECPGSETFRNFPPEFQPLTCGLGEGGAGSGMLGSPTEQGA